MSGGKAFFDSNILIYIDDSSEPQKQEKARALFEKCINNGVAVISTQCLQEFYNVSANKLKQDKLSLKQVIHNYATHIPTVQITPALIENAIDISIQTQFSFWDSLIVSAAEMKNFEAQLALLSFAEQLSFMEHLAKIMQQR